jgi:hypothetical protein
MGNDNRTVAAPEKIYMDGDIEKGEGHWSRCFETPKPCSEPAIEYIRADIALPAAPMGVKVKPLEWKECHQELRRKGQDFSARSPVRLYPISIHKRHDGWWLSTTQRIYLSIDAAQYAAFEVERDTILAALTPQPAPMLGDALELPEIRALVKAAAPYASQVQNADYSRQLREYDALVAALAKLAGGAE